MDHAFKCIVYRNEILILVQIAQAYVPNDAFDNNVSFVELMALRKIYYKPLPEAIVTQFHNAHRVMRLRCKIWIKCKT